MQLAFLLWVHVIVKQTELIVIFLEVYQRD